MAFAGDEQEIARREPGDGLPDRARAVADFENLGACRGAPARMARRIAAASSERGLSSVTTTMSASRAAISPMIGRLPASRSPPQPKATMSLPLRIGPQRAQNLVERIGLMRVIDDRPARLAARRPVRAGPARPRAFRARRAPALARACDDAEPGGDKRVRGLERAGERQREREDRAFVGDFEARRHSVRLGADEPQARAFSPRREHAQPPRGASGENLVGDVAVGVDDGVSATFEQTLEELQLGRKIVRHRRVIVEMVAREVGEGAGAQANAVEPALDDPVRGGFKREMGDAARRRDRRASGAD